MKKTLIILTISLSLFHPSSTYASELSGSEKANRNYYVRQRVETLGNSVCDVSEIQQIRVKVKHRRSYLKLKIELTPSTDIYVVNYENANSDQFEIGFPEVMITGSNTFIASDLAIEGELPNPIYRYSSYYWNFERLKANEKYTFTQYVRKPFKEKTVFTRSDANSFNDSNILYYFSYFSSDQTKTINTKLFDSEGNVRLGENQNIDQKYISLPIRTRGSYIVHPCEDTAETNNADIVLEYDPSTGAEGLLQLLTQAENIIKNYGYTSENPISVGNGIAEDGPSRSYAYLDTLAGPNGEKISYKRLQACCEFESPYGIDAPDGKRYGLLDRYEITYPGLVEPIILYINMYDPGTPEVPSGFTRK